MRLVDDEQPVRREVVEQRPRPRTGLASGEMARIVLDARAIAELAQHLEIERRPLAKPGRLEDPALTLQLADAHLHLRLDVDDGLAQLVGRRHEVGRRVDVGLAALREQLPGQRIELGDALDLVAEELDPDHELLRRRLELEGVAADPEAGATECLVVALVLEVDEVAEDGVAPVLAALAQLQHGRAVVDRRAEAVDARDAGDDDHVPPLEQRVRRGMAEPVDLVVARRVLLDVGVAPGQVRLGLVVVEVADEVLDGVVREELPELGVELGGERLVVGEHQRRLVVLRDRPGQRRGLAGAGRAEQHLVLQASGEAVGQAVDGGGLIARRLERGDEFEVGHRSSLHGTPQYRTNVRIRGCPSRPASWGRMTHTDAGHPRPTLGATARWRTTVADAVPSSPPSSRSEPGRVLPRPDAAVRHRARDHPVRLHLQRLRHADQRDARGSAERDRLRLRRCDVEDAERPRPQRVHQDVPARVDEPAVQDRRRTSRRQGHGRKAATPSPTAISS